MNCTAWPLVTHYVKVAVKGSTTMRLGHVFSENIIYAQQWVTVDTAKWWPLSGSRSTLRIMQHYQEVAHWWVHEEGQHVLLYQFAFRFHQYSTGTDSLAFTSASDVMVNPGVSWVRMPFTGQEMAFFSLCFTSKRISCLAVHRLPEPSSWASWTLEELWTEYATEQNPH